MFAVLAFVGVLAPVDLNEDTVYAQDGPVTDGTPSVCPHGWQPSPSDIPAKRADVCVYEGPSECPVLPWDNSQRMTRVSTTSELCEVTVRRAVSRERTPYNVCRGAGGVLRGNRFNNQTCQVQALAVCPSDTYPTAESSSDACRGIQRRTWTCADGALPRNEFNTCYTEPETPQDNNANIVNPACDTGSPAFEVLDCESYVGNDITSQPAMVSCADQTQFDTGITPNSNMRPSATVGAASDYWCEYNTAFLNVDCHIAGTPPPGCAPDWALCLKRASGAGGCETVAHNIRCRALQSRYYLAPVNDRTDRALEAIQNSCSPCVVLPFEPIPQQCPNALTDQLSPTYTAGDILGRFVSPFDRSQGTIADRIHELGVDYYHGNLTCRLLATSGSNPLSNRTCRETPVCQDPPSGELHWSSIHASQLAIVNSPLLFTINGIPSQENTIPSFALDRQATLWHELLPADPPPARYNPGAGRWVNGRYLASSRFFFRNRQNYLFNDPPDTTTNPHNPALIVRTGIVSPVYRNNRQRTLGFGECFASERPEFRLVIEELWPDTDRADIEELFGVDTLRWWDDLTPDQQQSITAARPSTETTEITCAQNDDSEQGISCRWLPTKSGYFRVSAAGAWWMRQILGQKRWVFQEAPDGTPIFYEAGHPTRGRLPDTVAARQVQGLSVFLGRLADKDGECVMYDGRFTGTNIGLRFKNSNGRWLHNYWMTDRDCIQEELAALGFEDPTVLGLRDDLSGLAPLPSDTSQEALYNNNNPTHICLGQYAVDLRIDCGTGGGDSVNYTETTSVGILVHELRVNNRLPTL